MLYCFWLYFDVCHLFVDRETYDNMLFILWVPFASVYCLASFAVVFWIVVMLSMVFDYDQDSPEYHEHVFDQWVEEILLEIRLWMI